MIHAWLTCNTSEGMFPSEALVRSQTADGQHFTLYADRSLLKEPESEGANRLRVYASEWDDGGYGIILPTCPFETTRLVKVLRGQITEPAD